MPTDITSTTPVVSPATSPAEKPTFTPDIDLKVLREISKRTYDFLTGITYDPKLDSVLQSYGLTDKVKQEAWTYMAIGHGLSSAAGVESKPGVDALRELEKWNQVGYHRVHAPLAQLYPEQSSFVFEGLQPSNGLEGVVVTQLVLDRLDDIEHGKGREGSRETDEAALATLVERGIDGRERARLRGLVAMVQNGSRVTSLDEVTKSRTAALMKLRAWFLEWSETARAVLERRADLIKLGLAKRQKRSSKGKGSSPVEPGTSAGGSTTTPTIVTTPIASPPAPPVIVGPPTVEPPPLIGATYAPSAGVPA